jgi:archaemetzincin
MNLLLAPVKFSNKSLLKSIQEGLKTHYTFSVKTIDLPIEIEEAYSIERGQYYSTQIIAEAIGTNNSEEGKIIILTEVDLFIPVLTYVFGEAQLNGKYGIVSVCRLHEEFYSGESNAQLLLERTLKEVLHELGHCCGLKHCINWDCVMHSSSSVEEVDIKGKDYCMKCRVL